MLDSMDEKETTNEKQRSKKKFTVPMWGWLIAAFLLGAVSFVGYRYATYKSDNVHYHANFALYIDGNKDNFKDMTFYEEVQACASDDHDSPTSRVHMHDENPALIHVHAHAVTWGHFFANIGYTLGDTLVKNDANTYVDGVDGNKLTFILNGQPTSSVANRLIKSEDTLLITYGKEDAATIKSRYDAIPRDAPKANTTYDPASCSGGQALTPLQRLKTVLGLASH